MGLSGQEERDDGVVERQEEKSGRRKGKIKEFKSLREIE